MAKIRATADPAARLALADEGHAQFPHGVFWQEREIIAIGALSSLGRASEAESRARAFVGKHPESPYAESLKPFTVAP